MFVFGLLSISILYWLAVSMQSYYSKKKGMDGIDK